MICPQCKNEADNNSVYCKFCGYKFPVTDSVVQTEISPKKPMSDDKKKIIISACAVIVIIALAVVVICLCAKGKIGTKGEYVTDAQGEVIEEGRGPTTMSVRDSDGNIREIKADASLVMYDSILTEYTSVMNNLKKSAPAFTKVNYQNLPTDHQSLGSIGNLVLPIIEKYVTSKTAAKPATFPAGNANALPLYDNASGCLLTDSSKIKNAYCEIVSDDEYKIVMTLKDEKNPAVLSAGATTSASAVSSVFRPYQVEDQISAVGSMALSNIDFNYTDCTVTLSYNPKNKNVTSISMVMNIDITADTAIAQIQARITDNTEFTNFIYQ